MFLSFQPCPPTQKDRKKENRNKNCQVQAGHPPVRASFEQLDRQKTTRRGRDLGDGGPAPGEETSGKSKFCLNICTMVFSALASSDKVKKNYNYDRLKNYDRLHY